MKINANVAMTIARRRFTIGGRSRDVTVYSMIHVNEPLKLMKSFAKHPRRRRRRRQLRNEIRNERGLQRGPKTIFTQSRRRDRSYGRAWLGSISDAYVIVTYVVRERAGRRDACGYSLLMAVEISISRELRCSRGCVEIRATHAGI